LKKYNSKEETYSTIKVRYGIERETDSFKNNFEELNEKAELVTRQHFKNKLDGVQIQIIINKVPAIIYFIMMTADDRLEQSQRWRKFNIDLYENWSNKINQILEDEYLTDFLSIDRESWNMKTSQLERDLKNVKKTRAGYNKDLEYTLKPLFIMLKGFKIGQKEQIDFIYKLFKKFAHKGYGGLLASGNKERIRKMQENAIKSLK
jgi:hypothetical protein